MITRQTRVLRRVAARRAAPIPFQLRTASASTSALYAARSSPNLSKAHASASSTKSSSSTASTPSGLLTLSPAPRWSWTPKSKSNSTRSLASTASKSKTHRTQSPLAALSHRHSGAEDVDVNVGFTPPPPTFPCTPSSSLSASDEADFKAHFDAYDSYRSATSSSIQSGSGGLFLFPPLQTPAALPALTTRTLIHSKAIVERIKDAPSDPTGKELRLVVKNLDRLSDLLCGVIDMCELVRNVHTDQAWVAESDSAYERLCSFMNELNTDQGLYQVSRGVQLGWAEAGSLSSCHSNIHRVEREGRKG